MLATAVALVLTTAVAARDLTHTHALDPVASVTMVTRSGMSGVRGPGRSQVSVIYVLAKIAEVNQVRSECIARVEYM